MTVNQSGNLASDWLYTESGFGQVSSDAWSSSTSIMNASVAPALVSSLATIFWHNGRTPDSVFSDISSSTPAFPIDSEMSSLGPTPSSGIASSLSSVALSLAPNSTLFPASTTVRNVSDDYGNNTDQSDHNIYIQPLLQQIVWSFIFGTMVVIAAGGNIIVIWIVLTHKRMRTVTNYFLVNLSVADITVSLLNVTFNFTYMLNADWPFGEIYCKISNFIAILSVAASVFTLVAISIDRYIAIVHPLRPRMSRTMTLNIIVCIWIASSLLSLPNIICSTTYLETFTNGDSRVICYLEWYDGPSTKSRMEYIYNIFILLVTYMLPIVSMSYTYTRVGLELWGSQSIGECTAKQLESIKSKQKIVKMMIIVVAIFGVCWAPYHIYFLLAHHYPQMVNSKYAQTTYLTIYWLAMANSSLNPFIYCWMNVRFRQGFKNILCCTCLRKQDQTMPRYHGAARYSCASEACITDMRVRFNGNGNITLQAATTSATDVGGTTGSSGTSPMQTKFAFTREML